MSQSWNTSVVREIREYLRTGSEELAKIPLRRGFLCPSNLEEGLKYKLTRSGEEFVQKYG